MRHHQTTLIQSAILGWDNGLFLRDGVACFLGKFSNGGLCVFPPEKGEMSQLTVIAYCMMERFLELQPGIRIEASAELQIEGAVVDAAPLMAVAGGTSPDALAVSLRQSDTHIRKGVLYPLDEYIARLNSKDLEESTMVGRLLLLGFYVLLVCGVFWMVYRFLLILSVSVKSEVDANEAKRNE